jgi:hypothetical protein
MSTLTIGDEEDILAALQETFHNLAGQGLYWLRPSLMPVQFHQKCKNPSPTQRSDTLKMNLMNQLPKKRFARQNPE